MSRRFVVSLGSQFIRTRIFFARDKLNLTEHYSATSFLPNTAILTFQTIIKWTICCETVWPRIRWNQVPVTRALRKEVSLSVLASVLLHICFRSDVYQIITIQFRTNGLLFNVFLDMTILNLDWEMLQKFLSLRFNNLVHDELQLIVSNEFNVGFSHIITCYIVVTSMQYIINIIVYKYTIYNNKYTSIQSFTIMKNSYLSIASSLITLPAKIPFKETRISSERKIQPTFLKSRKIDVRQTVTYK